MAPFTKMKQSSICAAVFALAIGHSPVQLVEGDNQSARYFGAQGATVDNAAAAASIVVRRELQEDRGECENSQQFRFEGDSLRTCDSYVAEKPIKRCGKKQPGTDGKRVKFFCPATCKKKCFTSTPISSPTDKPGPCKNSNAFGYEGDTLKTCDSYVAKKPYKRCRKVVDSNFFIVPAEDQDANKIRFYCPATCKRECKNTNEAGPCENSPAFGYKGNPLKTCDSYVAKKAYKRCRKVVDSNFFIVPAEDQDANKIRFHCPATCKRKCKNTKVPTASPSVTPTTSPTDLPTTSSSASPSVTESAMEAPTSRPVDPRDPRDPVPTASPSVTPTTSPTDLSTTSSSASSSATESAMETPTSRPVDPRDDPRDPRDPVPTASPSVTPTTSPTDLSTTSSSASSSATESAMETPTSRPVDPRDPS